MNQPNEDEVPSVLTSHTENATNIQSNDALTEEQRDKFQKLSKYNRGIWNGPKRENKKVTRRQDNLAILDAIAGQLELTDYQKKESRRILSQLDLQRIGREVKLIAFGVCILVANADVYNGYRYWPRATTNDEDFERVEDSLGYSHDTILSAMMTVRSRTDEGV